MASDHERQWCRGFVAFAIGFALMLAMTLLASARDDGRYADSPLKEWFDSLASGKGPCCSKADGETVQDADWDVKDGRYRVRLDGAWIDVPDDALITESNKFGRTMVWPMRAYSDGVAVGPVTGIRCFMPGSMT